MFGVSQNDESGASLLDSVLKEGEVCGNTFTAEAIIDKEVVSSDTEILNTSRKRKITVQSVHIIAFHLEHPPE